MEYTTNNYLCQKCNMWRTSKSVHVVGRGDINSGVLLLGEALGQAEADAGMPFVGASGKMLQHYLDQIGINCFISNAIRCHPIDESGNNRTPTPKEIDCCRAFTIELINKMKPKVIITIGKIALQQLIKIGLTIESARGKKMYFPELDTVIIPTYHPAYLMRTQDRLLYQHFVNDLILAKQIIDLPPQRKMKANARTLEDPVDIKKYLEELIEVPSFAFDLETRGFNHREDKITDISFCHTVGQGVHIQWNNILEFEDLFRKSMTSNNEKVGHNISFDLSFLMQLGFKVNGVLFDTMLAYHTLNMSSEGDVGNSLYKLETLSWIMTNEGGYKDILASFGGIGKYQAKEDAVEVQGQLWNPDDFESSEKGVITEYDKYLLGLRTQIETKRKEKLKELNLTPLQYYSAMDSDITYRLYKIMKPKIDSEYRDVFYNIIMKYCYSLIHMTLNGIRLDFKYMDKVARQNKEEIEKIKIKIFNKVGYELNLNSSKEISNLMYNVLGLEPNKNYVTKKGRNPAGDEEAITFFSNQKPILKSILEYRTLSKQNSTYLVGFMNKADKLTHRVHPSYYQLTATGRASCFLHTIPRDNKIRNMVRAERGNKLICLDQCLVGDTLVATETGLKEIQYLKKNEKVIQEDGSLKKVLNVFKQGVKEVYEVTTELGYKIKMTDLHRIRVIDIHGNYVWKNLKNLDFENDFIALQPFHLNNKNKIPLPKIEYTYASNKILKKYPNFINNSLCEFFGVLSGNGTTLESNCRKTTIQWHICVKDKDVINYIENILHKQFGESCSICKERRGAVAMNFNSKPLIKVFNNLGISKKRVPSFLFQSNEDLISSWLRGYFETDGSVDDRIRCSSVEESLIDDVHLLLLSLGIIAKKRKQNHEIRGYKFTVYILDIKSHWTKVFYEKIGFISKRKKLKLLSILKSSDASPVYGNHPNLTNKSKKYTNINLLKNTRNRKGSVSKYTSDLIKKDYPEIYKDLGLHKISEWNQVYCKISNIKKISPAETYDIEVEETHSYIANGFVSHNSQIELRVLAMMSDDTSMIKAFASGHDFHTYTACVMFGVPFDSFDKKKPEHEKLRSSAKAINFGIIFGLQARSLAEDLGITEIAALNFMNKFFSTYPNVKKFIHDNEIFVQQYGYVETLYGRKRYLSKALSSNDIEKGKALRQATNTKIQSSANDITAMGISRCQEWIEKNPQYRTMLVGTIHDSILIESPDKYVEELSPVFVKCMTENIPKVTMPLKVDVDIQEVWTK